MGIEILKLAWVAARLVVRIASIRGGADAADAFDDAADLARGLNPTGRRWFSDRARAAKIQRTIEAALDSSDFRDIDMDEGARASAQELAGQAITCAGDRLVQAATTRLATVDDLRQIVSQVISGTPVQTELSRAGETVEAVYVVALDAALTEIVEAARAEPAAELVAIRTLIDSNDAIVAALDRLVARIPLGSTSPGELHQRYLRQIEDQYAATDFEGRVEEITDLTGFLSNPGAGQWWWWQAEAWHGKTALMARIALNPPQAVLVIPFFFRRGVRGATTTADFMTRASRRFADLADLAGIPDSFPDAINQRDQLHDLVHLAAGIRHDHTLLILIDGLDEAGLYHEAEGTREHSVPGILPTVLPSNVKILLASRGNPGLPADVIDPAGSEHPLRQSATIHHLAESPQALIVRGEAQAAIRSLLQHATTSQPSLGLDLLAFVRTAPSQLTLTDLAALTGTSTWTIEPLLTDSAHARCFTVDAAGREAPTYRLAHDGLADLLDAQLGLQPSATVDPVRAWKDRIAAWVAASSGQEYPEDTPTFALDRYGDILDARHDTAALVDWLTDPARRRRLRRQHGHHLRAIRQLQDGLVRIYNESQPVDLVALTRIAVMLDHLRAHTWSPPIAALEAHTLLGNIDHALDLAAHIRHPASWGWFHAVFQVAAEAQQWPRAVELASTINDDFVRADAFSSLAVTGPPGEATELLDRGGAAAGAIPDRDARARAKGIVAQAAAQVGQWNRAFTVAAEITDEQRRDQTLRAISQTAVQAGEWDIPAAASEQISDDITRTEVLLAASQAAADASHERLAATLLDRAIQGIDDIADERDRVSVLSLVARAQVRAGESAADSLTLLVELAVTTTGEEFGAQTLSVAAQTAAQAGEWGRAGDVAARITDAQIRDQTRSSLAQAAARAGEWDRVDAVADLIVDAQIRDQTWGLIAQAAARAGEWDRVDAVADLIVDAQVRARAFAGIAVTASQAGDDEQATRHLDRATREATAIQDDEARATALDLLAQSTAQAGEWAQAVEIAKAITDDATRSRTLASLARTAAQQGNLDRAIEIAITIEAAQTRDQIFVDVTQAAAQAGDWDQANKAVALVRDQEARAGVLSSMALTAARAGRGDDAVSLLAQADATAAATTNEVAIDETLSGVAQAAAQAGEWNRAENVARTITGAQCRDRTLRLIGGTAARAAEWDRANAWGAAVTDEQARAQVRGVIARAAAQAGEWDRAEQAVAAVAGARERASALGEMAISAAQTGDDGRASRYLEQAAHIDTITDPGALLPALCTIAQAAARTGQTDLASALLDRLTQAAETADDAWTRARANRAVAEAAARMGDLDRAMTAATRIPDEPDTLGTPPFARVRAEALGEAAQAAARANDWAQAINAAAAIGISEVHAETLSHLAEIAAQEDNLDQASTLLDQAADIAADIGSHWARAQAYSAIAHATARTGQWSQAVAIGADITHVMVRGWALESLAKAAAEAGQPEVVADILVVADAVSGQLLASIASPRLLDRTALESFITVLTEIVNSELGLAQNL